MMPKTADTQPAGRLNDPRQGEPRIAVVFFGITRSLRLTVGSIRQNLIAPARAMASELRTFGHFYDQDRIDNPRSNESGTLDPDEFRLLDLDEVERELPGQCLDQHGFDRLKAAGDPWKDDFASLRNLVQQLHSLGRATDMALAWKPDMVVFARPDLYYHDSIASELLLVSGRQGSGVLLPNWGQWRGGLNDRFAIAKGSDAIAAYGRRVQRLAKYTERGEALHSELFLKFALHGVLAATFAFRASRVRSNGAVVVENFTPGCGKLGNLGLLPFAEFERALGQVELRASGAGK